MVTKITTIHEEKQENSNKILGILFNYDINDSLNKDSLVYLFNENRYVFFNTIIEAINYSLYGEKTMKRGYMTEEEFDNYYDNEIDDFLRNKIIWL